MGVSNKSGGISNDPIAALASRALSAGNPLAALNLVALREDPHGLALRGIAMAQLGDLSKAKDLLKRAARAFTPGDALARARCVLAQAEVALATRDLGGLPKALDSARTTLDELGDRVNSMHARFIDARRLLLVGRVAEAEHVVAEIDPAPFPPVMRAAYELVVAGIAIRRLQAGRAHAALRSAEKAAHAASIPLLTAEVEQSQRVLDEPAARLIAAGDQSEFGGRLIRLDQIEALLASGALIVDTTRRVVRRGDAVVSLAGRPLLFELARAMAEAWPDDVPRNTLIERAFEMQIDDVEDRLRLRVEIGRLRALLAPLASVIATKRGFALVPHHAHELAVLEPPFVTQHADVLAVLADGEAWSSSALALALGGGQRTVQRALESLEIAGKVQAVGRGRACRWMACPHIGIPTILLLPGSVSSG